MEGLILLLLMVFAELGALLVGAVVGAISFVVSIILAPLEILFHVKFNKGPRSPRASNSPARARISASPKFRKAMIVLASLSGVFLIAIIIVNTFFFESLSKKILTDSLFKKGATFECEKISGSLFAGRFEVDGLEIKSTDWSVSVEELKVDIAVFGLIVGKRTIEDLKLKGMVGNATLLPKKEAVFSLGKLKLPKKDAGPEKERKEFEINRLDISEVAISLSSEDGVLPPIHSIKIDSMACENFRSKAALFYLFFRSNTEAELNGRPLSVSVQDRSPKGKTTSWQADRIPLEGFHGHGAIFDFMKSGFVSLDVRDDWVQSDHLEVDLDWKLTFYDVETKEADEMLFGKPISNFINNSPNPFEIEFNLKMDPETFEGSASESAESLFGEISKGAINGIAEKTGEKLDAVEEKASKGIDLLKGVFDKARKK